MSRTKRPQDCVTGCPRTLYTLCSTPVLDSREMLLTCHDNDKKHLLQCVHSNDSHRDDSIFLPLRGETTHAPDRILGLTGMPEPALARGAVRTHAPCQIPCQARHLGSLPSRGAVSYRPCWGKCVTSA